MSHKTLSNGKCSCTLTYGRCKFVRGNRTHQQNKARYCFLRNFIGLSRNETRIVQSYSDSRMIKYLKEVKK